MGNISNLTEEQQTIFHEVGRNEFLRQNFYFTGGTALSAFYLHHRYSDDLDFFSERKVDYHILPTLIKEWSKKHHFHAQSRFIEVMYVFDLTFPENIPLKVDFSYYPFTREEKVLYPD